MKRFGALLWFLALLLIFGLGLLFGMVATHWLKQPRGLEVLGTTSVVKQVQALADLVSVKYVMEKVVVLNAPPESTLGQYVQGDNRVILLAHGIVKGGINLKDIAPGDVQISGRSITVRLPSAHITDCYLDEQKTQVIDWKQGFLRSFDKDLEQTARKEAVADLRSGAIAEGILREASERAQWQLATFLHEAGYDQVEFVGEGAVKLPKPAGVPEDGAPHF